MIQVTLLIQKDEVIASVISILKGVAIFKHQKH